VITRSAGRSSPAPLGRKASADAWRRLKRNRMALVGAAILVSITTFCFLIPVLLGLDPSSTAPHNRHLPPSAQHWFGTDALGRDYAARVLIGGQTSLLVGLSATLASVVVGVMFGAVSGYFGGKTDEVMMRFVDFFYGIPYMF
jgi:ABC-type dipeptide/oligopeptide/nickel transport system permease subunit